MKRKKAKRELHPDRALVLELLIRSRESQALANRSTGEMQQLWQCRANTMFEAYSEVRGNLLGPRP